MALMATLVMVSCGGSNSTTPEQFIDDSIAAMESFNSKAERAINNDDPEAFVKAFEEFAGTMRELKEVAESFEDNYSPAELEEEKERLKEKMERGESVGEKFEEFMNKAKRKLDFSSSQMKRLENAAALFGGF